MVIIDSGANEQAKMDGFGLFAEVLYIAFVVVQQPLVHVHAIIFV